MSGWRWAVLAVLVCRLLDPVLGGLYPYIVPILAVIFVAWEGGFGPAVVTLVISTFPRVTTTAGLQPPGRFLYASWLPVAGLAFLGLGIGSRFSRRRRVLGGALFLALMTLLLLLPACGGHSSSSTTTGTPAGTYTINVSATSGSFSQTTPITLVVQ